MVPTAMELATLRALTFRISSTTTSQLPQHVAAIAASLANCKSLLSSSQTSGSKSSSEAAVAVHKYRTLLSTLLQDRTVQGRWAAIVLIKATIEIGGWETLQKSLPWVRGLLGILNRPDPPSSKKLCIITLTRIFVLTRQYPTLVREITTPSLPTFIQSNLQIATSESPASLLQAILESFNQLLPRHPTIFRSYSKQLHQILNLTMAPQPSNRLSLDQKQGAKLETTSAVSAAARRLFTQLPCSVPKGASSEEWQESLRKTVDSAHRAADRVFRAVVEDWKLLRAGSSSATGQVFNGEVQDAETDSMGMLPWSGIFAGAERLVGLLGLIKDFIECATSGAVSINVAAIMDLLTRMLSLTVPSSSGSKSFPNGMKLANQVSKEERENLWLVLPDIHVAAIGVLLAMGHRCATSASAIDPVILDQLVWVFSSGRDTPRLRTACYMALTRLLTRIGLALPKSSIEPLSIIMRTCCEDLLSSGQTMPKQASLQTKTNGSNQVTTNADTFLTAAKSINDQSTNFIGLRQAAYDLLPIFFAHVPSQYLSDSLRARLDRTAILIEHKDAMSTSVLNPPPNKKFGKPATSILPLLVRLNAGGKDVEALLRPRMPVIRIGGQDSDVGNEGGSEKDDVDQDEEEDHFVGEELDALLETARNMDSTNADIVMAEQADADRAPDDTAPASDLETASVNPLKNVAMPHSGDKRPQNEEIPLSPTKRVKIEEELQLMSPPAPILQTTALPIDLTVPNPGPTETTSDTLAVIPPRTSDTTQIISMRSALPEDGPAEGDSDDEDIIPLGLGEDTDEESD